MGHVLNAGATQLPATASQSISSGFIIGDTYQLTLAGVTVNEFQSSLLHITISGGATAGLDAQLPVRGAVPPATLPFANYSLNFIVTFNNPVTITFTDNNNETGSIIDNVNLNLAPEPSAWAAMLAGMVVLGGVLRGRGCRHA